MITCLKSVYMVYYVRLNDLIYTHIVFRLNSNKIELYNENCDLGK